MEVDITEFRVCLFTGRCLENIHCKIPNLEVHCLFLVDEVKEDKKDGCNGNISGLQERET